jgi:outer membrane beta-barrel protein
MERRIRGIFLAQATGLLLTSLLVAAPCYAADQEQVIEPEIHRRDIKRTGVDTENFELGLFAGVLSVEDFGANLVYGARLGYHVTEDVFVELGAGQSETSKTSFERLGGNVQLLDDDDRTLTYYNFSFGFNLIPGEGFIGSKWAFTSALYLIGGIGSTRFAGDDMLTWNFGAGYRLLLNDWLALRLDARDHVFELDLLGESQTTNNLEFTGGVSVFF